MKVEEYSAGNGEASPSSLQTDQNIAIQKESADGGQRVEESEIVRADGEEPSILNELESSPSTPFCDNRSSSSSKKNGNKEEGKSEDEILFVSPKIGAYADGEVELETGSVCSHGESAEMTEDENGLEKGVPEELLMGMESDKEEGNTAPHLISPPVDSAFGQLKRSSSAPHMQKLQSEEIQKTADVQTPDETNDIMLKTPTVYHDREKEGKESVDGNIENSESPKITSSPKGNITDIGSSSEKKKKVADQENEKSHNDGPYHPKTGGMNPTTSPSTERVAVIKTSSPSLPNDTTASAKAHQNKPTPHLRSSSAERASSMIPLSASPVITEIGTLSSPLASSSIVVDCRVLPNSSDGCVQVPPLVSSNIAGVSQAIQYGEGIVDSYEQLSVAPTVSQDERHYFLTGREQSVRLSSYDVRTNYLVSARIPIVKVEHNKTKVHADVGYGAVNGVLNSDYIRCLMVIYRAARPLIIVIKAFLASHNLNEPYRGGLGGYPLALLVVSHLQQFRRNYGEEWKTTSLGMICVYYYYFFFFI
jgi:hypothetical protein